MKKIRKEFFNIALIHISLNIVHEMSLKPNNFFFLLGDYHN